MSTWSMRNLTDVFTDFEIAHLFSCFKLSNGDVQGTERPCNKDNDNQNQDGDVYEVTNDNHDAVFDVLAHPIESAFGLNLFLSKWNKVQIMNMYERL